MLVCGCLRHHNELRGGTLTVTRRHSCGYKTRCNRLHSYIYLQKKRQYLFKYVNPSSIRQNRKRLKRCQYLLTFVLKNYNHTLMTLYFLPLSKKNEHFFNNHHFLAKIQLSGEGI